MYALIISALYSLILGFLLVASMQPAKAAQVCFDDSVRECQYIEGSFAGVVDENGNYVEIPIPPFNLCQKGGYWKPNDEVYRAAYLPDGAWHLYGHDDGVEVGTVTAINGKWCRDAACLDEYVFMASGGIVPVPTPIPTPVPTPTPTPAPTGLLVGYHFSEGSGTSAIDWSTNGHNGTLSGAVAWGPGHLGTGLIFSGAGALDVANPATINLGTADFTVSLWVKRDVLGGAQRHLLSKCGALWGPGCKEIYFNASDQLVFGSNQTGDTFSVAIADQAWHHVAITFADASNAINFYVDGALRATTTKTLEADGAGHQITIGNHLNSYPFSGSLDEVKVYQRALTAQEIATEASQ